MPGSGDAYVQVEFGQALHMLEGMRVRARDVSPAWREWGDDIAAEVRENFASEGGRFGHAWAALTPRYARWKELHYPGQTILRLTDKLFNQITHRPMGVERIDHNSAVFGTNVRYGQWLMHGTHKMVARPFLIMTETLRSKASERILDHILDRRR